jgi:hypothetical protein
MNCQMSTHQELNSQTLTQQSVPAEKLDPSDLPVDTVHGDENGDENGDETQIDMLHEPDVDETQTQAPSDGEETQTQAPLTAFSEIAIDEDLQQEESEETEMQDIQETEETHQEVQETQEAPTQEALTQEAQGESSLWISQGAQEVYGESPLLSQGDGQSQDDGQRTPVMNDEEDDAGEAQAEVQAEVPNQEKVTAERNMLAVGLVVGTSVLEFEELEAKKVEEDRAWEEQARSEMEEAMKIENEKVEEERKVE